MAVGDDLPILPPDAVTAQPSVAEQQRAHVEQNPLDAGDALPIAPTPPPSLLNSSWQVAGKRLWDEGTRGVGLGTRAVVQGITSLPTAALDVATWPARVAQRAAGIPTSAPSTMLNAGLDASGLPTPQTPTEQNVSTAVRGGAAALPFVAAGGAPTVANAVRLLLQGGGGALAGKTASESDLVPGYAKPSVDLLTAMLVAKGVDVGAGLGPKTINAIAGKMSPEYDAFVRSGIDTKLLGTVAGGEAGQSAEGTATRIPFASSVLRPVQQKTINQFGQAIDRTAGQLDPTGASVTAQTTGEALQAAARDWRNNVFAPRQAAAWAPLNQRMAGAAVDPAPYRAALEYAASPPALATLPESQRAFASARAGKWLDALNADVPPGASLTWEQAQALKTRIGDAMGTPDIVSSIGNQQLKNIYGGLAEGMKNAAQQHGQGQLFADANAVTTRDHAFIDNTLTKIVQQNNPLQETVRPEQATSNILNGGDTTMQGVRRELPDAADVLAAHKLQTASTAKPSVAGDYNDTSTGTFLTNINQMRQKTPGGYDALYNTPQIRGQLEDLATVAQRLRATERHVNTSGTAEQLGWMAYLSGIGAAAGTGRVGPVIGAVAGPPMLGLGAGKLMTSQLATRLAAAKGLPPPAISPGRGGLLGAIPQMTTQ